MDDVRACMHDMCVYKIGIYSNKAVECDSTVGCVLLWNQCQNSKCVFSFCSEK